MADIKFSEFPKATTSKDSDEIAILQDGVNKMISSPVLESKIITKSLERLSISNVDIYNDSIKTATELINKRYEVFTTKNNTFIPDTDSETGLLYAYTHELNFIDNENRLRGVHIFCRKAGDVYIDFIKLTGDVSTGASATWLLPTTDNKFFCQSGWNFIPENFINIPLFSGQCYVGVRADVGVLGYNSENPNIQFKRGIEVNGATEIATYTAENRTNYIDTFYFNIEQETASSKSRVSLPQGQIEINNPITISNKVVKGMGVFSTYLKNNCAYSSTPTITIEDKGSLSNISFIGKTDGLNKNNPDYFVFNWQIESEDGITDNNEIAISLKGNYASLHNVHVYKVGSYGVLIPENTSRITHRSILNVQVYNSFTAYKFLDKGEYLTISNIGASDNINALSIGAGNVFVSSGMFNDNRVNLYMYNTVNNSHGSFTSCQFNHATGYAIYLNNITNGETFASCHVFEGAIYLKNCSGFNFTTGIIDAPIMIQGGTRSNVTNTGFQDSYWNRADGIGDNYNGQTSYMLRSGNYFINETGAEDNILNNI